MNKPHYRNKFMKTIAIRLRNKSLFREGNTTKIPVQYLNWIVRSEQCLKKALWFWWQQII